MAAQMHVPLESDLLRVFLIVAEAGNVTRAASDVGRTQSAVSLQLKRLEESVGKPLFERGPRGVALTESGKQLLPYARRIVDLMDETTAAMRRRPLDGLVRIGIPEEYGHTILPRALGVFAESHPSVDVTVMCGYTAQQMDALENDRLDLAVVFDWSAQVHGEVLFIDPTVWVTSTVHRLHERNPMPIAVYGRSSWCTEFAIRSLEQHSLPYRIAYSCDTSGGLKIAVTAGLAIAPLSRSNIPPDCRELTIEDGFPPIDSSRVVLRRNAYHSNPAVESMAEVIRAAFRPINQAGLRQA
ncbi:MULTISPECIES: LysR substrate-binding domain-containing protein [Rhizobium/Agrobacterium group]|uniref:LysR substrate-binding domain-containing protein n=1 Tax=Rhizobium/Agrobacterium group TaxID=227290 RepID=UPI0010D2C64D|nr:MULTISPECIES: LysR substrate-binding domain-containing protein [Rhizobium/Agrobacterium group]TCR92294.1 DNA-binding transcriptional LysR family regulator [Rhizobium sp. BK376]